MKRLLSLLSPALVGACTVVPAPDSTPPAPQGSVVALGQGVRVGDLTVTPLRVVEDSRCPVDVRCVWAGRLVIDTRIEGANASGKWRDTAAIRLGETYGTHDRMIALTAAQPDKTAGRALKPGDYRFVYERRDKRLGGPPPAP